MRDPSVAELLLFGRVLTRVPVTHRPAFAGRTLVEVKAAADHLRLTGRCHPEFGDGSLMARCRQLFPAKEPIADDQDFLSAMIEACKALLRHSGP